MEIHPVEWCVFEPSKTKLTPLTFTNIILPGHSGWNIPDLHELLKNVPVFSTIWNLGYKMNKLLQLKSILQFTWKTPKLKFFVKIDRSSFMSKSAANYHSVGALTFRKLIVVNSCSMPVRMFATKGMGLLTKMLWRLITLPRSRYKLRIDGQWWPEVTLWSWDKLGKWKNLLASAAFLGAQDGFATMHDGISGSSSGMWQWNMANIASVSSLSPASWRKAGSGPERLAMHLERLDVQMAVVESRGTTAADHWVRLISFGEWTVERRRRSQFGGGITCCGMTSARGTPPSSSFGEWPGPGPAASWPDSPPNLISRWKVISFFLPWPMCTRLSTQILPRLSGDFYHPRCPSFARVLADAFGRTSSALQVRE